MNRILRLTLPALAACGLSACAEVGPRTSYVEPLPQAGDAQVLAGSISTFLATQIPAASSTLALDPTPTDQASNALTPVLAASLRQQGFAITNEVSTVPAGSPATPAGHTLRYWITPMDSSGELVRLLLDGNKEASRFFVRNTAGTLQGGGPYTVMVQEASR
ncbi:MAG: hypothetical protein ACRYHQ_15755 [Janthinobacterium lividum]